MATVSCSGECKGDVDPPMVSAKCEASAKADASFHAECTPPSIDISYNLSASVSAGVDAGVDGGGLSASAEFDAKIKAFGKAYAKLLAEGARIKGIVTAVADLPGAAAGVVLNGAKDIAAHGDFQAKIQAGCAVTELPKAAAIVATAVTDLNASLTAIGSITTSVGG
jgi:hypothetical protein